MAAPEVVELSIRRFPIHVNLFGDLLDTKLEPYRLEQRRAGGGSTRD